MFTFVKMSSVSFEQPGKVGKCDTHEVPQCAECRNARLFAALHDFRITGVVRCDENNYGGFVSDTIMTVECTAAPSAPQVL